MPPSRKKTEPYLQGYLDKFCGIYAIINAIQELNGGRLSHLKATTYFNQMVRELGHRRKLALTVTSGMPVATLLQLLQYMAQHYRLGQSKRLYYNRPYLRNTALKIDDLMARLDLAKGNTCAIVRILGEGRNHWTVIRGHKRGWIKISDSDECNNFRLSTLEFGRSAPKHGYCIPPSEILFLRASI